MNEPAPTELAPAGNQATNVPETWVERWRAKQPVGSRRRSLYDTLALPIDPPTEFVGAEQDLVAALMPKTGDPTQDEQRAAEILTEASEIYSRAEERAAGATTRATTLQGAVAIAGSLLLAGAGLILDRGKMPEAGWRVAFALVLLGAVVALVMSGVRALSATSTIHRWHRPTATDIVRRSQLSPTEARVQLAAETLVDYGFNTKIAAWKVAYLGAAAWWFRIALAMLLVLAILFGCYSIGGAGSATPTSPSTTRTK